MAPGPTLSTFFVGGVGSLGTRSGRLPLGKVPWELVAPQVTAHLPEQVVLGPALGEDAAILRLGGELWAVAADPISFTTREAGRLAVLVNANDVAVRGAAPRFFLAVVLVAPSEAVPERVAELLVQIRCSCEELGVALVGGHTEVCPGLPHSMVVGTMLGQVGERTLTTSGLRPGDRVGLSKWAGLEGTSILLGDFGSQVAALAGTPPLCELSKLVAGASLSVVPEAAIAAANPAVSAMHDVTEGGLGEALHELAAASGCFIEVVPEELPILPETRTLCGELGLDPLGLIGSGALLVGCADEGAAELAQDLAAAAVPFAWIGRARACAIGESAASDLPRFPRDELLKAYLLEGIEAVLFDMDGTLVDSYYDWPAIRAELKVEGRSIIDELNALAEPERSVRWSRLDELERTASDEAQLLTGVHELLNLLAERGIRTALITNNSEDNTRALCERFGLEFDCVLSRDSGLYKPSGAPLEEAARRLGVAPERCLAVGDSAYDVLAARAAGCKAVAVVNGGACEHEAEIRCADLPTLTRYLFIVLPTR